MREEDLDLFVAINPPLVSGGKGGAAGVNGAPGVGGGGGSNGARYLYME